MNKIGKPYIQWSFQLSVAIDHTAAGLFNVFRDGVDLDILRVVFMPIGDSLIVRHVNASTNVGYLSPFADLRHLLSPYIVHFLSMVKPFKECRINVLGACLFIGQR